MSPRAFVPALSSVACTAAEALPPVNAALSVPISISVANAVWVGVIFAPDVPFLGSNALITFVAISEDVINELIRALLGSRPVRDAVTTDCTALAAAGLDFLRSTNPSILPSTAGTPALMPPVSMAFNGSCPVIAATVAPRAAPPATAAAICGAGSKLKPSGSFALKDLPTAPLTLLPTYCPACWLT